MSPDPHASLRALLTRREAIGRASLAGLGALVTAALPLTRPGSATAARLPATAPTDATLQAFADTMIPGARVSTTDLGNPVDPAAIAGADALPGAVQADALALYHHPEVGFDALAPAFLAELESRSLPYGNVFLSLPFNDRIQVCLAGLDFANPTRLVWEAAAAVPFTAFCAAALIRDATAATASGYRVMGLPGPAPAGYRDFSYRRRLSSERTRHGSLP